MNWSQIPPVLAIFSATAAKRSRGDVFRRETVLSDDLLLVWGLHCGVRRQTYTFRRMHVGWFGCIWVAPHMHLSFKMSCAKILRIYLSEKFRTPQDVHCHMSGCNYIAHRHVYRQNIRLLLTRSCKSAPAPCSAKSENYQLRMRIAVPIRVTSGNWGMRTAFNLEWVLSCNTQMCFCVNNWPSITLKVSANMHGITYTFSITLLLIICHIFYVELVVLVGTGIDWS